MGAPKPTLGYPSRTEAVLSLRLKGQTTRQIAQAGGPGLRKLAWLTLMETRARAARQTRINLFHRPADGGAA